MAQAEWRGAAYSGESQDRGLSAHRLTTSSVGIALSAVHLLLKIIIALESASSTASGGPGETLHRRSQILSTSERRLRQPREQLRHQLPARA